MISLCAFMDAPVFPITKEHFLLLIFTLAHSFNQSGKCREQVFFHFEEQPIITVFAYVSFLFTLQT